jgi:hypothetical protein
MPPHPFYGRADNARQGQMVPLFLEPRSSESEKRLYPLILLGKILGNLFGNRQFGLGIEEMQTTGQRRKADLITARNARARVFRGKKQNAPVPEDRRRCALSKAYCLASSFVRFVAAGLMDAAGLAVRQTEVFS